MRHSPPMDALSLVMVRRTKVFIEMSFCRRIARLKLKFKFNLEIGLQNSILSCTPYLNVFCRTSQDEKEVGIAFFFHFFVGNISGISSILPLKIRKNSKVRVKFEEWGALDPSQNFRETRDSTHLFLVSKLDKKACKSIDLEILGVISIWEPQWNVWRISITISVSDFRVLTPKPLQW